MIKNLPYTPPIDRSIAYAMEELKVPAECLGVKYKPYSGFSSNSYLGNEQKARSRLNELVSYAQKEFGTPPHLYMPPATYKS